MTKQKGVKNKFSLLNFWTEILPAFNLPWNSEGKWEGGRSAVWWEKCDESQWRRLVCDLYSGWPILHLIFYEARSMLCCFRGASETWKVSLFMLSWLFFLFSVLLFHPYEVWILIWMGLFLPSFLLNTPPIFCETKITSYEMSKISL